MASCPARKPPGDLVPKQSAGYWDRSSGGEYNFYPAMCASIDRPLLYSVQYLQPAHSTETRASHCLQQAHGSLRPPWVVPLCPVGGKPSLLGSRAEWQRPYLLHSITRYVPSSIPVSSSVTPLQPYDHTSLHSICTNQSSGMYLFCLEVGWCMRMECNMRQILVVGMQWGCNGED